MMRMKTIYRILFVFSILGISIYIWFNRVWDSWNEYDLELCHKPADVLILSMHSTGAHKSIAFAIRDLLKKRGMDSDIYYTDKNGKMHFQEFMNSWPNSKFKSFLLSKYYDFTSRIFLEKANQAHVHRINKLDHARQYKAIINVNSQMHHQMNCLNNSKVMILPTDLYPNEWWIPDMEKKTHFAVFDEVFAEACLKKGVPKNHIHILGAMPIMSKFFEDVKSKQDARQELGLPINEDIVFLMFGSCGDENMEDIMYQCRNTKKLLVFCCGKNEVLKASLDKINARHCHNRFIVLGLIKNVHRYMQASDLLIGKLGVMTMIEALASGRPVILNGFYPIPVEEVNIDFINRNKLGICPLGFDNIQVIIELMLEHREFYSQNCKKVVNKEKQDKAADILVEFIRAPIG